MAEAQGLVTPTSSSEVHVAQVRLGGSGLVLSGFCPCTGKGDFVNALSLAYGAHRVASLLGVRIHSTQGVAASKALARVFRTLI